MNRISNSFDENLLNKNIVNSKRTITFNDIILAYFFILSIFIFGFFINDNFQKTYYFYLLVVSVAIVLAKLATLTDSKIMFIFFYSASFFCLYFVLGFRNFSALDDHSYIRIFSEVSADGWWNRFLRTNMEPGYLILNQLVSLFTKDYLIMQLITSFIPLYLFYYAFYKMKNMISLPLAVFLLSTLMYFQVLSVGIIRMFIALAIVFNAYYYIPQKKIMKYVYLILTASIFHYSALFMLILLYFIIDKKEIRKKIKKFLVAAFLGIPLIFYFVAALLVPLLGSRYQIYGTINKFDIGFANFNIIPLILLVYIFRNSISKKHYDIFMLFISILSLSAIFSFYNSLFSLGRLIFYGNMGFFVLGPMVKNSLSKKSSEIIFTLLVLLYGLLYLYVTQFTLESHVPALFPYQNIFFNY